MGWENERRVFHNSRWGVRGRGSIPATGSEVGQVSNTSGLIRDYLDLKGLSRGQKGQTLWTEIVLNVCSHSSFDHNLLGSGPRLPLTHPAVVGTQITWHHHWPTGGHVGRSSASLPRSHHHPHKHMHSCNFPVVKTQQVLHLRNHTSIQPPDA